MKDKKQENYSNEGLFIWTFLFGLFALKKNDAFKLILLFIFLYSLVDTF